MKTTKVCLYLCLIMFSLSLIAQTEEKELKSKFQGETPTLKETLNSFIENLDKILTKLGNKRIAVLGFFTLDGPQFLKDAVLFTEGLVQAMVSSGRFEVVDRTLLGIENISQLTFENAKKYHELLKLGSLLTGTILRKEKGLIEVLWRLIELKNLTILDSGRLLVKTDWDGGGSLSSKTPVLDENSPLALLRDKITQINLSNLDQKTKEDKIIKTIAEFCRPSQEIGYVSTYFSCDIVSEYCKNLGVNDGYYKIYYKDEFVITVKKDGEILESYYYGKNHPVRKDINLEEFLKEKHKINP
ncbi:MAG: hypothetical protein N2Z79_03695, partial [Candidatus Omnitrophica bacterium]|nr:hypothetical protein [Candidatus Omnitrophota bacterium]